MEAELRFFDSAQLSDELRSKREQFRESFEKRVEYFQKNGDKAITEVAQLLAPLWGAVCARAIERATGRFADMLAQAVIARRGHKDLSLELRAKMWAECLEFAKSLAGYATASLWMGKAWGQIPQEDALPHVHRLETLAEQTEVTGKFQDVLRPIIGGIMHSSPGWLVEAERKINLRCLLSGAPERRRKMPNDRSKEAVARLLTVSPELSVKQACGKLDASNERSPGSALIPKSWQKVDVRSWRDAYDRHQGRVKTFFSKVRKEAGLAQT